MKSHTLVVPRTGRYSTLGGEAGAIREVWIGLHGYAQLAARFLRWLAPLDDGYSLLVAPEALSRFYLETRLDGHHGPTVGATWLTREHREADLADHLGFLDALTRRLRAEVGQDIPIGLLGFSQGAVMAARWLVAGQVRPERAVLWGTPLPRDVTPEQLAVACGPRPLLLVAGADDPLAPPGSIEAAAAAMAALGAAAEARRFAGGHSIPPEPLRAAVGRGPWP